MSAIAPCDVGHIGKMASADDIDLLVSRRPGLTELALAKSLFGRMGYQQRVNSTCRHLFREGRVERHGTGGPDHPFTYYPGKEQPSMSSMQRTLSDIRAAVRAEL
jgi:hypothetical protein